MKGKILQDHKLVSGKLKPPFMTMLDGWNTSFHEVPYSKMVIPEIIWQYYLIDRYGVEKAFEITLNLSNSIKSNFGKNFNYLISNLFLIPSNDLKTFSEYYQNDSDYILFQKAISPFISVIRKNPLNRCFEVEKVDNRQENISKLKQILNILYDKNCKETIYTIANIIRVGIELGDIQLAKEVSLNEIELIYSSFDSERSKHITSAVRSAINPLFRKELLPKNSIWVQIFWDQCYSLEPITITNLIHDHNEL